VHVAYKGAGPAVIGLIAGEAHVAFYSASSTAQHVKTGRLRALGTTTGEKRSTTLPELPTIAEAGLPGYEASTWAGALAPANTPQPIINTLHRELTRIVQTADVKERLAALEFTPVGSTPQEFDATIRREVVKWAKVVKDSGAKLD